jgi:hypothetical protein
LPAPGVAAALRKPGAIRGLPGLPGFGLVLYRANDARPATQALADFIATSFAAPLRRRRSGG